MQPTKAPNNTETADAVWTILPATEKDDYIAFHTNAFEEDLKHAEKNILEFPRWSIISGYYCMHDLTRLFLADRFHVKVSGPEVHAKTIEALEHFVRDAAVKAKLVELLIGAKNIYVSAERLKERTLPVLLRRGKQERGKAQYYSAAPKDVTAVNSQKAAYFLETIVRPYVGIVGELMK